MKPVCELAPEHLRSSCDPSVFNFKNTAEVEPLDEVIGQERAVRAIDFGLNMESPGYNIFVTGVEGTGKTTIVREIVSRFAEKRTAPFDWCMVNNFKDPFRPKAVAVPTEQAYAFAKTMERFVKELKEQLQAAFEHDTYQKRHAKIQDAYEETDKAVLEKLEALAREKNLGISETPSGYQPIPLKEGNPMTPDEFESLSADELSEIEAATRSIRVDIEKSNQEIGKARATRKKSVEKLMQEVGKSIIEERLSFIRDDFEESPDILGYLEQLEEDLIENVDKFTAPDHREERREDRMSRPKGSPFDVYKVNVLVENKADKGAPVVYEPNPTFQNLFGRIENSRNMGPPVTDFSMVQAGSLPQANGGYLILDVDSVVRNPQVWDALKRALQNKLVYIEDAPSGMGYSPASLRPEPIPLEVKVILLGGYDIFQGLQNNDSRFNKIFKVRADFDYETGKDERSVQQYARFIAKICKELELRPFTPRGVAAIVEYGEKSISHKEKLSLRFGPIVSIIKEAEYWARKEDAPEVTEQQVYKAYREHRFRYNLYEEKVQESYMEDTILMDVDGEKVGQINALAVHQMGDISFGRPSRITAATFMGKHGIVNIEREARLSGKTHDKGMMILTGYLGSTFADHYPLSLSISITFEQSYGGIDGDSASSTELYAVLSSLSGMPLQQGIAVTGSVNQKGEIQAVGGVNQKIEGFFEVCRIKGLTGKQGVMIPKSNVTNLMLKHQVISAVKEGMFHIYAVSHIWQGIEILTGLAAGRPDAENVYPEDSVYGKVQKQLAVYLERSMMLRRLLPANYNGFSGSDSQ